MNDKFKISLDPIPARAGVGLKAMHYRDVLDGHPDLGFFEVHTENYMGAGGPPHRYLEAIRRDYPLSMHGIGLSLGSAGGIDAEHLARTKAAVDRYQPGLVSEHLSFSVVDATFLNDLVPLPYTEETLAIVTDNISRVQDGLGRTILLENPSSYLSYHASHIPEPEFLAAAAERSGCGILLDVNNVYVSAVNHGFDAIAYLDAVPANRVGEIHLAGHHVTDYEGQTLLIDDHGAPIIDAVWRLYSYALSLTGPVPTLIERDSNIPPLADLMDEAAMADRFLEEVAHVDAA